MFKYDVIQSIRGHAHKLDSQVRNKLLDNYRPLKWIPCFLQQKVANFLKKRRKLSVLVEFDHSFTTQSTTSFHSLMQQTKRSKIQHQFSHVPFCSVSMAHDDLEHALSNCSNIKKVYLNHEVKALLDTAVKSVHAEQVVRQDTTLTGQGVTIAVVDTGIYPHPDIKGRIVDFVDLICNEKMPYDDNGHGTHCAGDAASDGYSSEGLYRGPAPKANLVGVKALDRTGSGSLETIMKGIEWCIDYNVENPGAIDIISLSLGAEAMNYGSESKDPLVQVVESAWRAGMVVCVAAGNEGPDPRTISSPGVSTQIITVGATDDNGTVDSEDDRIAEFSSRGPTIYGNTKPDVVAPGTNIVSLRAPGSYLDKYQKSNRIDSKYFVLSGTSMATPIVAGVVALMLENDPTLTPDMVKTLLVNGTTPIGSGDGNTYGAGVVNAEKSIH